MLEGFKYFAKRNRQLEDQMTCGLERSRRKKEPEILFIRGLNYIRGREPDVLKIRGPEDQAGRKYQRTEDQNPDG